MGSGSSVEVDVAGLGPGEKRVVEHDGLSILVCNVDNVFYAIENVCSHAAVPLSDGELQGCEIECIFHGALFDVRDGQPLAPPATRPVRTYPVEQAKGHVTIRIES